MPKKESPGSWYVHLDGETMGPMSTDMVHKMLQQNRVQFLDFIFGEGMYQWTRISDVEEFKNDVPAFPKVPPPGIGKPAPAAAPAAKKKAAPAKPPRPVRAVAPVEEEAVAEPEEEVYEEEEAPAEEEAEVYADEDEAPVEEEVYEEEEAPAPPPKRRPAPAPAPRAAPRPAPAPARPAPRPAPVAMSETVSFKTKISVDEFGDFTCDSLAAKYVLVKSGEELPLGQEVKFVLQSNDLKKPRMLGIVIEQGEGKSGDLQKIEFIKVNPMHRRAIEDYVKTSQAAQRVKKAS